MVARGQSTLSDKYYQLGWDNDVFMMTDYYYTQGINFTTYHPFFRHNPLNLVLIKPKRYTHLVNGFSASQKTYTPKDIKSNEIQYADRPYAGVLTFTSHVRVANADKGWLFNSSLDVGVMGPASGAGQVQYKYHEITENPLPNGWHYQQYNWPVLNYNFEGIRQVYQSSFMDVYAKGGFRAGSLHNDAAVGFLLRMGKRNDYLENLGLPFLQSSNHWQLVFSTEPTVSVVAYNATLMGGWHRNPKIHYVEFAEMNKIVGRVRTSIGLNYQAFGLLFDLIYQTKEFNGGTYHWYTSAKMVFIF